VEHGESEEKLQDVIRSVLRHCDMPVLDRQCLLYIFRFFHAICSADLPEIEARSISVVIGPNIIYPEVQSTMSALSETQHACNIVRVIINNPDVLS